MNRRSLGTILRTIAVLGGICAFSAGSAFAGEGNVPAGVPHLDHVFLIMMENHAYAQIVGNPDSPFTNAYMKSVNAATNYFAVAHPSLTNYLEITGGSNFGILNDNSPDWHNGACTPNIVAGATSYDNSSFGNSCPIAGTGTDAATPVFDTSNETAPPAITSVTEIDGVLSIPAAATVGKTIADQLWERGLTWKSYQESLPPTGADRVNNSDGFFSDVNPIKSSLPAETQSLINLYAVKHNPFVYFKSVQEGGSNGNGLGNSVGFQQLYADLASGQVPSFSFIVPNQCNDQHGRGNAGPGCDFDITDNGTLVGLNPALIHQGDLTIQTIVQAIHGSPAWAWGHNAIIVVWDENDYSATPITNQVLLTVDTNYGVNGTQSNAFYTHFSVLKTLDAGFGLPCLNHACDANVATMSDLFAAASSADVTPAPPARFTASATWTANGKAGSGNLVYLSTDTRGLWFFSPDNLDVVFKVVDGRAINGKFWVFYGSLTAEAYSLTITDTVTGAQKTYTNAAGQSSSGSDTSAF